MKTSIHGLLPAAICAALATSAHAADVSFPDSGTDLADAASWGGTPPAPTDRPLFEGRSGTVFNVTAREDVSFAGILFGTIFEWATVTFDLRDSVSGGDTPNGAPRTVTLTDSITTTTGANRYNTYFRGGKWIVNGNLEFYGNDRKTVQDGAEMTLTGNIQPAHGAANNSLITFTGAGTEVSAARALTHITGGYYGGNVIAVRDGASLTLTGGDASNPAIKTGDQGGDNNGVVVSGAGASLTVQNDAAPVWIGSGKGGSHSLRVEDGGAFATGGELRIGSANNPACVSNAVVVTGAGSTLSADMVNIGYGSASLDWAERAHDSRFVVADGAVADISGLVTIGYSTGNQNFSQGSEMVVSNATFRSPFFPTIGMYAVCSNNVLRVIGPDARFEAYENQTLWGNPHCTFFQMAKGCLFEIDGASVTNNVAHYTRLVAQNLAPGHNSFRLQNGAEFFTTNIFSITGYEYAAPSNTVEILSGSRLYAGKEVMTYSEGNRFVIDDGILESGGNISVTKSASSSNPLGHNSTNKRNELSIGGANGQVLAENGTITIARESTLRFKVPVDGYAANHVPMKARTITITTGEYDTANDPFNMVHAGKPGEDGIRTFENSTIEIEGVAERANNKALTKSETVTLATATSSLTIPDDVLAAANARIKGFGRLFVADNALKLRVSALNAAMIFSVR